MSDDLYDLRRTVEGQGSHRVLQSQQPLLRQEQKLRMTPQLYQAIKIMAMPLQELTTSIQQELERNPALEVIEDPTTTSLEEPGDADPFDSAPYDNTDFTPSGSARDDDAKRRFLEGALSRPETLQEHLLWQLRLQPIGEDVFRVGELLIQNLDANGFHREPPKTLVAETDRELLTRTIELIQGFEPVGSCSKDSREALAAQARLHPDAPEGALETVSEHLEAIQSGKLDPLRRSLGKSGAELDRIIAFIRELEPLPGRQFGDTETRYVVPDLFVRTKDGELEVVFNDEVIPILGVSSFFEELAGTTTTAPDTTASSPDTASSGDQAARKFATRNLQDARWFIRSIRERNRSLVRVAVAIVELQREFFHRGPKFLVPLTLKDIANEVDLHETTVSRLTTGKYLQTEAGIFELKYFFTNSISGAGSSGSRFSKTGVKEMVREIIAASSGKPLSDSKIMAILAEQGVKIARRTVAKYRKELDIASSFDR